MAWRHQTTSHCLNQYWSWSISYNCITWSKTLSSIGVLSLHSLTELMACHPSGTKPLSKPMALIISAPQVSLSLNFESKYKYYLWWKYVWKIILKELACLLAVHCINLLITINFHSCYQIPVSIVDADAKVLTHWGQVMHICISILLNIIASDNGLSPGKYQAIIWTNDGILLTGPRGTNFSEIFSEIWTFSFKIMHLNVSSAKGWPFRLCFNVLKQQAISIHYTDSIVEYPWLFYQKVAWKSKHLMLEMLSRKCISRRNFPAI